MSNKSPILIFLVCFANMAFAKVESEFIMEGLPPHLLNRAAHQASSILLANVNQSHVVTIKTWDTSKPLKVCFFGGSNVVRKKIAGVANSWARVEGTSLKFDFGDLNSVNSCGVSGARYDIRIGFAYKGYWSTVGTDSVNLAAQHEQSMNLSLFNINPPSEPEFSRVVLHEFGHAIGLAHEHQIEESACPVEFNWDAIYTYLKGAPNYWSKDQIDHNLRPIEAQNGDYIGDFDKESIMLYTFPKSFYKSETPKCFTAGNYSISKGDKDAVTDYYPSNFSLASQKKEDAFEKYSDEIRALSIPNDEKDTAISSAKEIFKTTNFKSLIQSNIEIAPQAQFNYERTFINSDLYKSPVLQDVDVKQGGIKIDIK